MPGIGHRPYHPLALAPPHHRYTRAQVRSVIFCVDCQRPRLLYSMTKPSADLLKSMDTYAEDISFACGDPLFEDELEDEMLLKLKETFFVKEARSCTDWVERDFFNTGAVKGRTEFEFICSICGTPPEDSPLVADAVLGLRDGKKLLPCCEDCHAAKKKPLAYGKADQPVAQAAKRKRKAEQRESAPEGERARKAEERMESTAKRPARGRGRGRERGRGRGRGRGQIPDSTDEEEEIGGARTPPPHAPAPPSGSDEDSGSSPSLDDSD